MPIYNNSSSKKQNEKFLKLDEGLSTMLYSDKQVASLKLEWETRYKLETATFRHNAKRSDRLFIYV